MSENISTAICRGCGKEYEIQKINDNFCSYECWEKVNCCTPQKCVEPFDMGQLFSEGGSFATLN